MIELIKSFEEYHVSNVMNSKGIADITDDSINYWASSREGIILCVVMIMEIQFL